MQGCKLLFRRYTDVGSNLLPVVRSEAVDYGQESLEFIIRVTILVIH